MASYHQPLIFFIIFVCIQHHVFAVVEFQVGGNSGWVVPPANDSEIYNNWASEKRFTVGDTLRFRYKKDSVMEVKENGYNQCNSTYPSFYSNSGNTVLKLDRPGFFYFISGANGHCRRGQRMIIRVMSEEHEDKKSVPSSSSATAVGVSEFMCVQSVMLFLASSFF